MDARTFNDIKSCLDGITGNFQALKSKNADHDDSIRLLKEDVRELAQKLGGNLLSGGAFGTDSLARSITDHPNFKFFHESGQKHSGRIEVKRFFEHKDAITSDGSAGALVVATRAAGIIVPGQQRLTIRDLLRVIPTTSNAVEFVKELTFDNNAAIVHDSSPSPTGRRENVVKPESAFTFELASERVETIAHWVPVSKQILADVPAMRAYIDGRMRYGLKEAEENELLNGPGTQGHLNGLINQASDFDSTYDFTGAGETAVDRLGAAIAQAEDQSDLEVDGIVLNNVDWAKIRQLKNSGDGAYVFANPQGMTIPMLWGKPVIVTKSITRGTYLVGAFRMGADLWDREQATVEISREHADFFTRNMAAILCEERLALAVTRPSAFVHGVLPS